MSAEPGPLQSGPLQPGSLAVSVARPEGENAPLNHPIVLASNFRGTTGLYSRHEGTDTWHALEAAVGALEGGTALSFGSGLAAAACVLFALRPRVIVLPSGAYMGVRSLISDLKEWASLEVRMVDISDTAAVEAALTGADLLWIETPTNPTLSTADVPALVAAARREGARIVVDSTFATPIFARPLSEGADVVIHSGTKFIGGHSDLLIGLAVMSDPDLVEKVHNSRTANGSTPGALEAFLALRGLRTLPLRMERAAANASVLVERLRAHPGVDEVRYPGWGAMVSFIVRGGADAADTVCRSLRLAVPATSLGGVETTIERRQKYAGEALVPPGLLRMSVGIEDIDDLWADLSAALESALPGS